MADMSRDQMVSIVRKMETAGESPDKIKSFVSEYKGRMATPVAAPSDSVDTRTEVESTYSGNTARTGGTGGKFLPTFARRRDAKPMPGSVTVGDKTYPKATGMLPTAGEIPMETLGVLGDVLGISTRWAAQARGQDMANPEAALWSPEIDAVKSSIDESGLPAPAKGVLKFGTEVLGGTLSDPVTLLTLASAAVKGASKVAYPRIRKFSSEMSGVPEDALETISRGPGRKQVASQFGREGAIADELLMKLRKFDDYLPEKQVINNALDNMPAIGKAKVMDVLEASKVPANIAVTPEAIRANELISGMQERFMGVGPTSAKDYRQMRITLDDAIGTAWGKESGYYIDALKKARHQMAQDLIESAQLTGNPEYVEAMSTLASKMHKRDELLGWIGKTPEVQDRRTMSFVDNLFGKNKQDAQRAMKNIDEIFFGTPEQRGEYTDLLADMQRTKPGEIVKKAQQAQQSGLGFDVAKTIESGLDDMKGLGSQIDEAKNMLTLSEQAKLAQYAQQVGPQGVPAFMPMQGTGRTMMGFYGPLMGAVSGGAVGGSAGAGVGGVAGLLSSLATASPALSSRVTLPLARLPQALPSSLRNLTLPAAAGTSSAFQDALGRQLLNYEGEE